jgi:hypothetical protein
VNVSAYSYKPRGAGIIAVRNGLDHSTERETPPCRKHDWRRYNRIEVKNSLPQSSQDQAWSIRPLALNRDCSATSNTLPHSGQFGRLNFAVASIRGRPDTGLWHAG